MTDRKLIVVASYTLDEDSLWGAFVRMLIWTGQRRSEVSEMSWSELHQEKKVWVLQPERTKNSEKHIIPLCKQAVTELDEMAGSMKWPIEGFVFSHKTGRPISGYAKIKPRLDQKISDFSGEEVKKWQFHDLRRTFATNLQRLGIRSEVIEALINHVSSKNAGVVGVYQTYDWHSEKVDAMNKWGDWCLGLFGNWPDVNDDRIF